MTSKQSNQVTSWIIFAIGGIVGFVYHPYIGMIIVFLAAPLRIGERDNESEYFREFCSKYKYLVYPSMVIMLGLVVFLLYIQLTNRVDLNIKEVLIPIIVFVPVAIFFEYKLFKKNA